MDLIKELNKSLQPKDRLEQVLEDMESPTYLHDEQVEMLVDYMHEMIRDRQKRGNDMSSGDAAFMALEDVAGFETASKKDVQRTGERLIAAYKKKYG